MAFRILFVCAANVCRSPTAARIFTAHLPDQLSHGVVAESAGVAAQPGSPWCPSAQKWVARHKVPVAGSSEHRSTQLTPATISCANLILAADSEVKSVVLRADLRARTRLFTLLEAAALARGVAAALADSRDGLVASNGLTLQVIPRSLGDPRLAWLVTEMDAARGLVVPAGRGRRSGAMDILDPHARRDGPRHRTTHARRHGASHRTTLRALWEASVSLSSSMGDVNVG